jgi:hypothetical protein
VKFLIRSIAIAAASVIGVALLMSIPRSKRYGFVIGTHFYLFSPVTVLCASVLFSAACFWLYRRASHGSK